MQRRLYIAIGVSLAVHAALAVIGVYTLMRAPRVEIARGDDAPSRLPIGLVYVPSDLERVPEESRDSKNDTDPQVRPDVESLTFESRVEPPRDVAAHEPDEAPQLPPASEAQTEDSDTRPRPSPDEAPETPAVRPGITREARPRTDRNRPPSYPAVARRRGWEGTVLLELQVLADGRVAEVTISESSGHEVLDEAAARAVRRWRFEPALHFGKPTASTVRVPIRFRLLAD